MSSPARQDERTSARLLAFEPPPHWQIKPLRYLFEPVGGATPSKDNPAFWEGTIPWVSPKDMKSEVITDSEDHISEAALNGARLALLPPSTVLVVVRGMILAHTIPVAITAVEATINQDMKGLSPKKGVTSEYLAHLLRAVSPALFSTIEESGHGTRCLRLDLWRNILVGVPPEDEQRAIVSFVEERSAYIDSLIAKKRRMIGLVGEKRQALISHAVTKGLDPTVPMKDSGIPWLGEIPAHWAIIPLKRRWNVIDCKHRTVVFLHEGIPVASIGEVRKLDLDLSLANKTNEDEYNNLIEGGRKPRQGDIIYSRNATVGAAAYVATAERFCMGQDVCLITSNSQDQRYLVHLLRSPIALRQIEGSMIGATFKRINVADIRDLMVTCPPSEEQKIIARSCDRIHAHTERIDDLLRSQLEKLCVFRQTLISAALMGKIQVPTEATS